ncbi:MAG TPA: alpha-L-fucosidase [Candidatus Hydrogenedentes bacterium]|nr:alpha-L-fucosidase [Candidatus Hydrogenedentota bacterium]
MRPTVSVATLLGALLAASLAVSGQPTYEPTWESLDGRAVPAWFNEAKFGIFIHWGVYAVPSWSPTTTYSEWYWNHMQDKNGETWKFHVKTYGEDFQYQDFAPMFKAELFDPALWADLFKRAGARYVVLTSKHHDGFCLWPSPDSWNWNAVDIGPHRDVLGDLTEAVRSAGIRMGYYYSYYEWFHPVYRSDVNRYVEEHMMPQIRDLVTRYQPSILWLDGEWDHPAETWRSTEFLAWLFNESPVKEDIVINDRWGKGCRGVHGGFYTSEYGGHGGEVGPSHPWEEDRGMGASFGYNRNETVDHYKTPEELIRLLVDTAARGGNLLLDIGPTADGRIPEIMQERLVQIGDWLIPNGDSIYGSAAGPFVSLPWGACTSKPGRLYLHVFDWPDGTLEVPGLKTMPKQVYFLTDTAQTALPVSETAEGLAITVPACPRDTVASVIVLEFDGDPAVDTSVAQAADGSVSLAAARAAVRGEGPRYEAERDCIGYWTNGKASVAWDLSIATPGTFKVAVTYACESGTEGCKFAVGLGDEELNGQVKSTAGWSDFITEEIGTVTLAKPGRYTLTVTPKTKPAQAVMNLRTVALLPVG